MCGMKINLLVSTLPNYGQSPLGPKYLYSIIFEAAYYYVPKPSTTKVCLIKNIPRQTSRIEHRAASNIATCLSMSAHV